MLHLWGGWLFLICVLAEVVLRLSPVEPCGRLKVVELAGMVESGESEGQQGVFPCVPGHCLILSTVCTDAGSYTRAASVSIVRRVVFSPSPSHSHSHSHMLVHISPEWPGRGQKDNWKQEECDGEPWSSAVGWAPLAVQGCLCRNPTADISTISQGRASAGLYGSVNSTPHHVHT